MDMKAIVLESSVRSGTFYDQLTGQAKSSSYTVNMTVFDGDTQEKYSCQFSEGFAGLAELKQLSQTGTPEQVQQALDYVTQNLPPQLSRLDFQVARIKGKGTFITLVCRFVAAAGA